MTRSAAIVVAALSVLGVSRPPQTPQMPQAPPVFRGGTEIVALDVTVLDKNRLPVRGLTQDDFTIVEDGQPQHIVAFDAVDLPDRVDPPAKWMVNVTPDIATNSLNDSRLFVLVMDDAMMGNDQRAVNDARKIAHRVVDELGPADLMAVVFPRDNRYTQDFTSDHTKLAAAVDHFTMGFAGMGHPLGIEKAPEAPPPGIHNTNEVDLDLHYKRSSIDTVAAAADFLGTVPDRRKILIYLSTGVAVGNMTAYDSIALSTDTPISDVAGDPDLGWRLSELIRLAREGNVSVYTIDPCGLRAPSQQGAACPPGETVSFLRTVAGATGGHAIVDTNAFDAGIDEIFHENASYYLVGYRSSSMKPASSTRRVDVKVTRPGIDVKFRHTYRPTQTTDAIAAARPSAPARSGGLPEQSANAVVNLSKALTGILPTPDMPLQVTLAPFAIPGKKDVARVAVILGLRQPIPEGGTGDRVIETIDLQTKAFTPEGQAMGSSRQIAKVTLVATNSNEFRFEVLSQIDLKPGRYQLRLGAYRDTLKKSGSVYGDVVVPDFSSEKVSLSGVVLASTPAPVAGGQESLKTLLPVVPTSERTFLPGARVTVFCRAYQGKGKLAPVAVTVRIVDGTDRIVTDNSLQLGLDKINASTRAGDIRFQLPIAQLPAGPYDLWIEATAGSSSARRDVRFNVK